MPGLQSNYSELDFKFKEADIKAPETKKGDYNFLSSYLEPKQPTASPAITDIKPTYDLPAASIKNYQPATSVSQKV